MKSYSSAIAAAILIASTPIAASPCTAMAPDPVVVGAPRYYGNDTIKGVVSGTPEVIGLMEDPSFNRDSCGSTRFGTRHLWTCRDSQHVVDGKTQVQVFSSTASWTKSETDGSPLMLTLPGGSLGLPASGNNNKTEYFPRRSDDCSDNTAGICEDHTRYPAWPDSPPMVTSGQDGDLVIAYTWIRRGNIRSDFSTDDPDPKIELFKITYDPTLEDTDEDSLPTVESVNGDFWPKDGIPYGVYGHTVKDGIAYLWGQPSNKNVALAKVPVAFVEDVSKYQYWVDGAWTTTMPAKDDPTTNIQNVSAGGQGTYYYSAIWRSYVWIGQPRYSLHPDFFITTAPEPTGPWETPKLFYTGEPGTAHFGAYTLQAHPDMVAAGRKEIYISYTKVDDVYTTPMIRVTWK